MLSVNFPYAMFLESLNEIEIELFLKMLIYWELHTYIIGHYNPST